MDIATLRRQLDKQDARIVAALGARMKLSLRIALLKASQGLPQRDLRREAFILRQAARLAKPPLSAKAAKAVLAKILEVTRAAAKAALKHRGNHGS